VALTDYDTSSSTTRRVNMLGKGMAAIGHEVHIIIPQRFRPGPLIEEMDGLTIHWGTTTTYKAWRSIKVRLYARWATIRAVDRLAANGLNWLLLYNMGLEGILILAAACRYGALVATEYCDVRMKPKHLRVEDHARIVWHGLADTLVPRYSDINMAISRYLEQWLRAKAPCTPTLLVPPLVDTEIFRVQPEEAARFREKWKLGNLPIIAYLGSYWVVEGISTLLRSVSALAASGAQFKLVISGSKVPGLDCDDVPSIVKEMALDRYVVQTGWLPTKDVIASMSAADILVVPKSNDIANKAGLATKMAEYLSMGRAVVATRVGDVPLYLRDGIDSVLCTPDDQSELTNVLRRLLNTPAERSRLGINARQTAINSFDCRSVGRRICEMMQQIQSEKAYHKRRKRNWESKND
jgi:glycosyltransferase involved in cell wall biosynthesis